MCSLGNVKAYKHMNASKFYTEQKIFFWGKKKPG